MAGMAIGQERGVAWQTGLSRPAVSRALRRADLVEVLAETGAAWRAGQIATAAVDMLGAARVAGHDEQLVAVEGEWLDWARRGDHSSLKILTRHFAHCARADGTGPDVPDGLTLVEVGDRHQLHGEFSATGAETIHAALDAFTRSPGPEDGTTGAQRRAEAMVRICEVALARGPDGEAARPVVSYLTHARVDGDPVEPLTFGTFTGVIAPGERDRLMCDSTIVPIITDRNGRPRDVGRTTSVWPRRIRRAMGGRDHHCQWPGCDIPAPWCDAHHFRHWERGGRTSLDNGLLLCRRHHTFLHAHPNWTSTFDDQHLRVYRPDGTELARHPWPDYDTAA